MLDANTCFLSQADGRILALYSHAIPAAAVLLLGAYGFSYSKERYKAGIFLAFTLCFVMWLLGDLANWTLSSYTWVAATWAPLDFLEISFFALLFLFLYADHRESLHRVPSSVVVGAAIALTVVPFIITLSGSAVGDMDLAVCEMGENAFLAQYKLFAGLSFVLATLAVMIAHLLRVWPDRRAILRTFVVSGSIVTFLALFSGVEYVSTQTGVYETMLYMLFVLPLFVLVLTLSLTSFGTLDLGRGAARLLFFVFILMSGTQFFSITSMFDFFVAAVGFVSVLALGTMLFRSYSREEELVADLEVANQQQLSLINFISHEVKGTLGKGYSAFGEIVEGDYGEVSPQLKTFAQSAFLEMKRGVSMVMDILDASNLKKGTLTFKHEPLDFAAVVMRSVDLLRPDAEKRSLALHFDAPKESVMMNGDVEKLEKHVVRNLIDNALKYTPSGSVTVTLATTEARLMLTVRDTGVGIERDDFARLFTEGGRGKDSTSVNVQSTGYGLFIAKQVVEAHHGHITAESAGKGQGSTFTVELPRT